MIIGLNIIVIYFLIYFNYLCEIKVGPCFCDCVNIKFNFTAGRNTVEKLQFIEIF